MAEHSIDLSLTLAEALRELRNQPSIERWHQELSALLKGDRSEDIDNVGSSWQYICRLFGDSSCREDSHKAFHSALTNLVAVWHPSLNEVGYNSRLLQIIADFRPVGGLERVLARLVQANRVTFYRPVDSAMQSCNFLALAALESYYELPGASTERTYSIYAELLRKHATFHNDIYVAHCFRRLLELRLLDPKSPVDSELTKFVLQKEGVLSEFLQYATGISRGLLEGMIGTVLAHCLELRDDVLFPTQPYFLYDRFTTILDGLGAHLIDYPHPYPTAIELRDKTLITLQLPMYARSSHAQASANDETARFGKHFQSSLAAYESGTS